MCKTMARGVFVTLFAVAISLASIGQASAAKEMKTMVLGSTIAVEALLPVFVAWQKGFLKEEGLNFKFVLLGGSKTRDALAAGQTNFGMLHVAPVWVAQRRKLNIKFVHMYYKKGLFGILISSRLKDKVKTIADLKGLKGMTFIPGSASHAVSVYYLSLGGLKIDRDVKFSYIATADPKVWHGALETGKVDILSGVWEPILGLGVSRGIAFPLLDVSNPDQHQKFFGGDINTLGLVIRGDTIDKDPELVMSAIRAMDRALTYMRTATNDELADLTMATKLSVGGDRARVLKIVSKIRGNFEADGRPSVSKYNRAMNIYMKGGFLKKPISFDQVVDSRFTGRSP